MIRVGLIGVGHWGPNIARSLELGGRAAVTWICDLDERRLALAGKRQPRARTTARVAELFADRELDAVAISTPVTTHFRLAAGALEAEKHVLVEKPMTRTAEEAEQLVALADRAGRVLMVGHVFEYNASVRALKELIDRGELGRVQYMSFTRTNLGPVRTDVNALWDLASHDVSIMTFLIGEPPVDVSARGHAWLNPGVEDAVFATFSFKQGVMAHVNVSWLNPRKIRRITVVGDRKMALWDDLDLARPIQIFDRHVEFSGETPDNYLDFKTAVVDGGVFIPSLRLNQPLQAECEHFLDCIESGKRPHSDGRSGLRVVAALEAASLSMQQKSVVTPIPAPR